MRIQSRLNYFFILFRLALLTFLTPLACMLLYMLLNRSLGDAPLGMKIFLIALTTAGVLGVAGEIFTYRHVFPTIIITDQGIQQRNFLGLGCKRYYHWSQLSGYDTSHISMKGASAGVVKVFRNKRCVIELNAVVYANFDELAEAVSRHLNRYPGGPRVEEERI